MEREGDLSRISRKLKVKFMVEKYFQKRLWEEIQFGGTIR